MLFGKMRGTIAAYRAAAATLDPRAVEMMLAMLSSARSPRRLRRVAASDPELAVALFLLQIERDNGVTPAQFNEMVSTLRDEMRELGVAEDEVEGFIAFHLWQQLDEQGLT